MEIENKSAVQKHFFVDVKWRMKCRVYTERTNYIKLDCIFYTNNKMEIENKSAIQKRES